MKNYWHLVLLFAAASGVAVAGQPIYTNNFDALPVGGEPEGFLIIDGQFAVREFEGGKVFELPGSPLETFGFLFGPNAAFNESGTRFRMGPKPEEAPDVSGIVVSARVLGSNQGRRFPAMSLGLCGVSGFKLKVSPMKKAIELLRGDEVVASQGYDWASGKWTRLKLQVRIAAGKWVAEGKAWQDGQAEPAEWQLNHSTSEKPNPGKASGWAAPFSGEPIRFDDLKLEVVQP